VSIFESKEKAENFLRTARAFYWDDPDTEEGNAHRCLNMNDTFAWALAYGPYVDDDQLIPVAELCWRYGNAGLNYWCTVCPDKADRIEASEFEDVQRGIDFVRHEEELRLNGGPSHKRAYKKLVYTLGDRS